ncbi:universal stress protein [Thauera sp. WB-2]|uniref:universal stress protein n=2 Tax=unclassified Thauera TaxID=2609274 RepID=UPI0022DE47A2|nr:universal stress protein [Thauera sp. WB-2]WBL64128.1 universal stress protein [Thauera sp. WB-2]
MSLGRAVHQKPGKLGRNAGGRGEAEPKAVRDEARTARHATGSPGREDLLAQALASANMEAAWKRVKSNRGSAGVDGLSIAGTADYLRTHWPRIRESLLDGSYRPLPVRRVQIPKPDGGVRELGIPTVTDRLIQQALLQVLQRRIDPTFSDHSYGFRPGRRAQGAPRACQGGGRLVGLVFDSTPPLAAPRVNPWLVAVDNSDNALRAVAQAARDTAETTACALHLVHVQPWLSKEAAEAELAHRGLGATARARALLDATGSPWRLHIAMGDPAERIPALAAQLQASGIVIGSRGLNMVESLLLGSVAYKVMDQSALPVMVVP